MAAMTALFCYRHRGTAGQIAERGSAQEWSASGEDADPAGVEPTTISTTPQITGSGYREDTGDHQDDGHASVRSAR